jgi:hypothetical protein
MNWVELRERWGGDLYFEWIKHDLADRVDLLLVDCDLSGDGRDAVEMLATSAADVLVVLSNYSNDQTAPTFDFLMDLTGADASSGRSNPASILLVPAGIEVFTEYTRYRDGRYSKPNLQSFCPRAWMSIFWRSLRRVPTTG